MRVIFILFIIKKGRINNINYIMMLKVYELGFWMIVVGLFRCNNEKV